MVQHGEAARARVSIVEAVRRLHRRVARAPDRPSAAVAGFRQPLEMVTRELECGADDRRRDRRVRPAGVSACILRQAQDLRLGCADAASRPQRIAGLAPSGRLSG